VETAASGQSAQGGNPVAPLPAPGDAKIDAKVDFDRRNPGQTPGGDAAPGLKYQPSAGAATPATATQPQRTAAPEAKPANQQGGITFEKPDDSAAVDLRVAKEPLTLRSNNLKEPAPKPSLAPVAGTSALQLSKASVLQFLFPEEESKWPGPKDPNFPLINPLREEPYISRN
jgi:hypothetical protein